MEILNLLGTTNITLIVFAAFILLVGSLIIKAVKKPKNEA